MGIRRRMKKRKNSEIKKKKKAGDGHQAKSTGIVRTSAKRIRRNIVGRTTAKKARNQA